MDQENNQIGAGEFKTHCLKLIDRVNQTKQPIIITKHGKPMAKLTSIYLSNLCLGIINDLILLTRDRKILDYGSEKYTCCLKV